jgi:hypothetical protein
MFAQGRMDDTAVEENLGSVGDLVKHLQCLIELIVVVAREGCHPGFDFLPRNQQLTRKVHSNRRRKVRTCFRDMTSDLHVVTRQYGVVKPRPNVSPTAPRLKEG